MLLALLGVFLFVWILGALGSGVGIIAGLISCVIRPPAPKRLR